jgi:DNA-directed RNA polymerase alpha subunit
MLRVTCTHCHMPFIMNREALSAALEEVQREGYKHYNAYCPNCGRQNTVSRKQLVRAAPWWKPTAKKVAPAPKAAAKAKQAAPTKKAPAKKAPAKKAPAKAAKPKAEAPSTRKKLSSFDFNARTLSALEDAGVSTVAAALKKLGEGKQAMLELNGIGPAALDEIKKVLKKAGYKLPAVR